MKNKCIDFYKSSKFMQKLLTSDIGFDRKIELLRSSDKMVKINSKKRKIRKSKEQVTKTL